jgi:hypothetical protein
MHKKVIGKTSLTYVFANNFFWVHFFTTFSTESKSAWNSAFFDTHIEIFNENFVWLLLALFLYFDYKFAKNGSKKQKMLFINVA